MIEDISGSQVKCVLGYISPRLLERIPDQTLCRTRVSYDNTESDFNEDDNEPEENWKVEANESESDIDAGDVSDEDDERRIR